MPQTKLDTVLTLLDTLGSDELARVFAETVIALDRAGGHACFFPALQALEDRDANGAALGLADAMIAHALLERA